MAKKNILIVEDDFIIALGLASQLISMGFNDYEIIDNGQETLKKVSLAKFDLILMDIKLKGELDGIEVAKIIRKYRNIPIVYVSGNTDFLESDRLKKTKHEGILGKPVTDYELIEVLNKVFQ